MCNSYTLQYLDMVVENGMNLPSVFVPRFFKGYCVYLISLPGLNDSK